jgi:hypothetical protein
VHNSEWRADRFNISYEKRLEVSALAEIMGILAIVALFGLRFI